MIQCLDLLKQICSYPVNINFRHRLEKDELYFSIGISAKLNQQIINEAFGFSNASITYSKCPIIEPLPIGNIIYQPFKLVELILQLNEFGLIGILILIILGLVIQNILHNQLKH